MNYPNVRKIYPYSLLLIKACDILEPMPYIPPMTAMPPQLS